VTTCDRELQVVWPIARHCPALDPSGHKSCPEAVGVCERWAFSYLGFEELDGSAITMKTPRLLTQRVARNCSVSGL